MKNNNLSSAEIAFQVFDGIYSNFVYTLISEGVRGFEWFGLLIDKIQ